MPGRRSSDQKWWFASVVEITSQWVLYNLRHGCRSEGSPSRGLGVCFGTTYFYICFLLLFYVHGLLLFLLTTQQHMPFVLQDASPCLDHPAPELL